MGKQLDCLLQQGSGPLIILLFQAERCQFDQSRVALWDDRAALKSSLQVALSCVQVPGFSVDLTAEQITPMKSRTLSNRRRQCNASFRKSLRLQTTDALKESGQEVLGLVIKNPLELLLCL